MSVSRQKTSPMRGWARMKARAVSCDERHLARDDRAQAVVHDVEVEALQVGDVARNMEREDLPLAAFDDLVAAGEAFEDQAALRRPVLVPDDVLIGLEVPQHHRQADDD